MKTLYHGTTLRRHQIMLSDGYLKPAPQGDAHVSLTDCPNVAAYFAHCAFQCDDFDEVGMVVLSISPDAQSAGGIDAQPFSSEVWGVGECDWEREFAWAEPIPIRRFSIHQMLGPVAKPGNYNGR